MAYTLQIRYTLSVYYVTEEIMIGAIILFVLWMSGVYFSWMLAIGVIILSVILES